MLRRGRSAITPTGSSAFEAGAVFEVGDGVEGFREVRKARKIAPVGGAYRPGREASSAVKFWYVREIGREFA